MASDVVAEIGGRVKCYREAIGMTQDGLAGAAGVSKSTLNGLEHGRGNPTIRTLERIAEKLHRSFWDLTSMDEIVIPPRLGNRRAKVQNAVEPRRP